MFFVSQCLLPPDQGQVQGSVVLKLIRVAASREIYNVCGTK